MSIGIVLVALLSNCGLKGDLYLPEPEKAAQEGSVGSASAEQPDDAAAATSVTSETADDKDEKARAKQSGGTSNQP